METNAIALGNEDSTFLYNAFVESDAALDNFVGHWKGGTLPKKAWTHAAHVAMAAYITFDHPAEPAFEQMKAGVLHHNASVGTANTEDSGYHETLTRFWCAIVGDFVRAGSYISRFEAVRAAVSAFGENRNLPRLFYSFDLVSNRRARREWVPPDRRPAMIL